MVVGNCHLELREARVPGPGDYFQNIFEMVGAPIRGVLDFRPVCKGREPPSRRAFRLTGSILLSVLDSHSYANGYQE